MIISKSAAASSETDSKESNTDKSLEAKNDGKAELEGPSIMIDDFIRISDSNLTEVSDKVFEECMNS